MSVRDAQRAQCSLHRQITYMHIHLHEKVSVIQPIKLLFSRGTCSVVQLSSSLTFSLYCYWFRFTSVSRRNKLFQFHLLLKINTSRETEKPKSVTTTDAYGKIKKRPVFYVLITNARRLTTVFKSSHAHKSTPPAGPQSSSACNL